MIARVSKTKINTQYFTFADNPFYPSRKIMKFPDTEANVNNTSRVLKNLSAYGKAYNNIFRIFY